MKKHELEKDSAQMLADKAATKWQALMTFSNPD